MLLLEPNAQIWMKIDPYMQRQKSRPMTLVSRNISCMRTFGSSWREHQMRVGLLTTAIFGDLIGYFFRNFRDKARNIVWPYATPCWPVTDCKMNDLEWPWVAISRVLVQSLDVGITLIVFDALSSTNPREYPHIHVPYPPHRLTFAADSMGLSSLTFFLVGFVKRFYLCKSDVLAIQGHSRSLILVPIESAYATSY